MSTDKSDIDHLADISEKLDVLIGLAAIVNVGEDLGKFIPRLKAMGLTTKAISRVTGMTENAILLRISRSKAAATKKPGKKAVPPGDQAAS